MKTKFFLFLATVGVARGIFLSFLIAVLLLWAGLTCALMYGAIVEMSIEPLVFIGSLSLIIFGACLKIILDTLSWAPEAIKPRVRFQKNLDIAITLGLAGLAIIIFWNYYTEDSISRTIVFGVTALCTIYLFHKNGLFGSGRFFLVLFIAFVVFILHTLIIQYYYGRHNEIGNDTIMLVGFYLGLIVLTKIPERLYQSWIKSRIEKMRAKKAEKVSQEKADKDRRNKIDSLMWLSLLDLGRSYIDFAAYEIGDYEEKQAEFYLEVFFSGIERGKKMNTEELKSICYKISRVKHKLDQKFLNAVTEQCLSNNMTYLVFTTTNNSLAVNEWPILFKRTDKKAALVAHYLTSLEEDGLYDFLFDASTQIFNIGAFTGLMNCLGHCYKKSDDDLKNMAQQEMKRVLRFAKNYCEKINFMESTKERLRKRIAEIEIAYWECAT